MSKWTTILAFAAAGLATGALAREPEQRFTRDGVTYVYTVAPTKAGRQVIEGRRLSDGSAFRLVVTGNRVDGVSGGQPVSFRTPRTVASVEVAAR